TINPNLDTTLLEEGTYVFSKADFGFTDPHDNPNNLFQSVKVTTLPTAGTLTLNNGTADVGVSTGAFVLASDIAAGKLKFTPATNGNGATYATFTFQVKDDGLTANGGIDLDPTPRL